VSIIVALIGLVGIIISSALVYLQSREQRQFQADQAAEARIATITTAAQSATTPLFTPAKPVPLIPPRSTLIDRIQVPADGGIATSNIELDLGSDYVLRASGIISVSNSFSGDAEYVFNNYSGVGVQDKCDGSNIGIDIGVGVDNINISSKKQPNWGPFNLSHVYMIQTSGKGKKITLNYHDCGLTDNLGYIQVDIFRL